MTEVDLEQFISNNKPVIYKEAFVKFYTLKNYKQVFEIYEIIRYKKMYCNFDAYWIIDIFSVFCNTQEIFINQVKIVFYVHNHIDQEEFNQLYDLD